jgi:hypothetical protein
MSTNAPSATEERKNNRAVSSIFHSQPYKAGNVFSSHLMIGYDEESWHRT